MTFKQPRPVLPTALQDSDDETEDKTNESAMSNICQVCGDEARIVNYGALSCMSCKTFFRRNGFRVKNVRPCRFNGNCEVNMLTRRICTACRLGKCLAVGMDPDLIRKEDLHGKTCLAREFKIRKPGAEQARTKVTQVSALDLVCVDRSSLDSSDWTLISNIVRAYDTYSSVSEIRRIIERIDASPLESGLAVSDVHTLFSLIYRNLQSFIYSTADFRVFTVAEQHSLYLRNLHGIVGLYAVLMTRDINVFYTGKCEKALTTVYGVERVKRWKTINMQLEEDLTLVKLMLVTLIFSSNCDMVEEHDNMHQDSLLRGTFRLFGSQNVYIELLWKYMIHHYGYVKSVLRFAALIQRTLEIMKLAADIRGSNNWHRIFTDDIVKQAKKALTINENEGIPLWGKK